jgi:pimeloyl-ACP methyl ester carboxylesterase
VVVLPGSQPVGGILVVLHGYGSDGAGHQSFFPVSPASGLVTVVPSGRLDKTGRRYWAANEVCCSFDAPLDDVDVTYVLALLDAAEARWSLPRGQARLAGHSNGAALAVRLACEHPERFSKVVAFAGPVDAVPEACAASKFAGVRERTGPSPIGPAVSRDAAASKFAGVRERTGPSPIGPAVSRDAAASKFAGVRERTGPSPIGPAVSRDAAASKFAGVRERTGPSIVIAHGRNDRVVPYAGGSLPPTIHPNARGAVALGAEALVASLRGGGCSTVGRDLAPLNVDGARPDLETTRRVFLRDCDASSDEKHTVIELWSMDRVGHAPYAPTEAWRAALEEFFLR